MSKSLGNSLLPDPGDSILVFYGKGDGHITAIVNGPLAGQVIDFINKADPDIEGTILPALEIVEHCVAALSSLAEEIDGAAAAALRSTPSKPPARAARLMPQRPT